MSKIPSNNSGLPEVTVTGIGVHGDGIANGPDGRYFIPYAAPGDRLSIVPGQGKRNGRAGKIHEIIARGAQRIEPACAHFGSCGGCSLQHVSPKEVARTKRDFVRHALAQHGLDDSTVGETVEVPPGTRRRVRFAVHRGRNTVLGFRAPRSRQVVAVKSCPAARPAISALIGPLGKLSASMPGLGKAATILVTESDTGPDLLFEPGDGAEPGLEDREALAHFANRYDLARVAWNVGGAPEPVSVRRQPKFRFGTATIAPPPGAFLQPSAAGENVIVGAACTALSGARRIADLYAGCGALSFPFSSIAPTHAFESDPEMVAAIRAAGDDHPVSATVRDLAASPLAAPELEAFDAVVFDPPRPGARIQAAALAASSVNRIVAVSCNPGTLARDLRLLVDGGYAIVSVLPIDQFPWSAHVEAVAVLQRDM